MCVGVTSKTERILLCNVKIALITIGFIVGPFEKFGNLENCCFKKNKFRTVFVSPLSRQRENKLESKNVVFYSFLRRRNFHLKRKSISRE